MEAKRYKRFNKDVKKLVKENIREFETNLAINSKKNPKSVYSYINNKTNAKESIKSIKKDNGVITTDRLEIVNTLNEFFASVFIHDDSLEEDSGAEGLTKCPDPCFNKFIVQKH